MPSNQNDQDRFVRLFASAQPALTRFVCAHIGDVHRAEDLVQDVAARLWQKFDTYELGTSFQAWAFRVAQFEILHAKRSSARSKIVLSDELARRAAEHFETCEFVRLEEERRMLSGCIEKLSPSQHTLVTARYTKGMSCSGIARELGRGLSQVRVQLFRIRAALRKCVDTGGAAAAAAEVQR